MEPSRPSAAASPASPPPSADPAPASVPDSALSDASTAFEVIRLVTRTMLENASSLPALEAVVNLISAKMKVEVCSIYIYDDEEKVLKLAASRGLNLDPDEAVRMSPEEGLTGYVFRKGDVLNIADPVRDKRNKYFPTLGEERLGNFLGIPIPPESRHCLGVLTLQSTEKAPFAPTVEDLAYTLAAQLGTLLENQVLKAAPAPGPADGTRRECPPFLRAQVALGGIAYAPVTVLNTHQIWDTIIFSESGEPARELLVLRRALEKAIEESRWLKAQAGEIFAELDARIFEAHELMLRDIDYVGLMENLVREGKTAPFAVKVATRELSKAFAESGVPALASKCADLRDVGLRILNALGEVRNGPVAKEEEDGEAIVASVELLPSDLIYMRQKRIVGIICETGGVTSHAAILARSLGIPCFMGVPNITSYLQNGTPVILDGNSGLIFIRPDDHVSREYHRLIEGMEQKKAAAGKARSMPPFTRDGVEVRLSANLSLLSDMELMEPNGIQGVGLYRSEFLFMIRSQFPDEETQFQVYRKVVERSQPYEATIRVLDVGGDKPLKYFDWGREENPYLGWRSIRMLLARPDILKPQLRALLRTGRCGRMNVVVPMVALVDELRRFKGLLLETRAELEEETGETFPLPPVGAMVEIPSAVLQIGRILTEVDFACIGTNDLIQYLFAIDRGNERVAAYYQPFHPALLSALGQIAAAAKEAGKPVTVCGEMASDVQTLPLLLGLGVTRISLAPAAAGPLRDCIRSLDTRECRDLVQKAMNLSTAQEVKDEVLALLGRCGGGAEARVKVADGEPLTHPQTIDGAPLV